MTGHRVVYSPEAEAQMDRLSDYLAAAASPEIARNYLGAIVEKCESLIDFPDRGTPRSDLRAGLRTIPFRRRVTIVYAVGERDVTIIGIFYGGQNFDALLRED